MKFAIAGVTGFIGTNLSQYLQNQGHQVIPITRHDFVAENRVLLKERLVDSDCVINLSGAPIYKKWTSRYKKELYESRIATTAILVELINELDTPPSCFISTSAVGYYAPNVCYNESTAVNGTDFLARLCRDWEAEVSKLRDDVRRVITRFGLVISEKGGIYPLMSSPAQLWRVAVQVGNGANYLSWIHLSDLIHAIYQLATHRTATGVFNLTAPQNITQHYLVQLMAQHYHTWFTLTLPFWMLKLKFGEAASVFTQDLCVKPDRLLMMGFQFRYTYIDDFIAAL